MRIFVFTLLVSFTQVAAHAGSVRGQVPLPETKTLTIPVGKYRGKISGKVAAPPERVAAVWLEANRLSAPPAPQPVSLAQGNYQFSKSLLIVPKGTQVFFPNKDPDYHNIYSLSKAKRFDLGRYKAEDTATPSVLFDRAGFVSLHCEIHDHMRANVIVVNTPYYTTTNSEGVFHLKKIPPGHYTLHAQFDRKTKWSLPITVSAKAVTSIQFPAK